MILPLITLAAVPSWEPQVQLGKEIINIETRLAQALIAEGFTDLRVIANILAQVRAESNFYFEVDEKLGNYTAENLYSMFGPEQSRNTVRFQSLAEAEELVKKGEVAIGDFLYGGRFGNGKGEGYKYRGRGLLQLTFKANYAYYSNLLYGDDRLVADPDLVRTRDVSIAVVVAFFKRAKKIYDLSSIREATKAVGPAYFNLPERQKYADEYFNLLRFGVRL